MVDRLERQILEIIGDASSLVRTVTRREIESGVLFPSVTAIDIRRNLPNTIQLGVIESRLQLLEKDGYIYSDGGRWWLTRKGQSEVGQSRALEPTDKQSRPISSLIEESFAEHGEPVEASEKSSETSELENLLVKLEELYTNQQLTTEERSRTARSMLVGLLEDDESIKKYLESRSLELASDIEKLENELTRKKSELRHIQKLVGEK